MKRNLIFTLMSVAMLAFSNFQLAQAQFVVGSGILGATTTRVLSKSESDSIHLNMIDKYSTKYYGVIVDSATKEPIQSAVIYLMGVSDMFKDLITKSTVTDKKGRFEILVSGPSKLEVSCLGYKLHSQRINPPKNNYHSMMNHLGQMTMKEQSVDIGVIRMAPDPYSADEAVVKARIQMFEQRGDTTRIFPKLAKTMEGDALIEVIKQIPGFKVEEDGTIYENGRKIERTYINNTLLFGEDPRTAFLKLTAENALAIDTYEEKIDETEAALTNRKQGDDTRRVANITTTRKMDKYTTMEWLAESGLDHDKDIDGSRNIRYGLSGEIGSYRVGQQLTFDAEHTNIIALSSLSGEDIYIKSGNPKNTKIGARGHIQLGDSVYDAHTKKNHFVSKGYITGEYNFDNNRNTNISRSSSTYFPSINFDSQIVENSHSSNSKSQNHRGTINYMGLGKFPLSIHIRPEYSKEESFSDNQNVTTTDGSLLSKTHNTNRTESKRYGISSNINSHYYVMSPGGLSSNTPSNSISIGMTGNLSYRNNDGGNLRNYEITDREGTNLTTLTVESERPNINADINGKLQFNRSTTYDEKNKSGYNKMSRFGINVEMGYRYSRDKNYTIAINQATGEIDYAYSGDYIKNNSTITTGINIAKQWKSGVTANFGAEYSKENVKSDEEIPNNTHINRDFSAINYNASFSYNNLNLSFNTRSNVPYANQLSSTLDVDNPMYLSSGNPNLKSGKTYSVNLHLNNRSFVKTRKVTIHSNVSFSVKTDPVTTIRRYFKESTILPEYGNYEAVAGATLTTLMNVGSHIQSNAFLSAAYMLQKINTSFGISFNGNYSNPFTSIDEEIIRNESSSAKFEVSVISTPTRKLRLNISNQTAFSWQKNDKYSDRSRANHLKASLRVDFMNRLTFTPMYTNTYQKAYTTGQTIEQNALNLSLGARVLKKRNGLLSINVYNIFNNNSGYSLLITDQYISENWRQQFARFYSISFKYKFNSLDHSK